MFGIIDDNKKFILLDEDQNKLRTTALMLAKEEAITVEDFDIEDNKTGEHTETRFVPMFDEETVDAAIKKYTNSKIEKAYNGDYYVKGNAPEEPENEVKSKMRSMRDSYINDIEWRISRYREQVELNIDTTDTQAEYNLILQYIQYLRDYPQTEGEWWKEEPKTYEEWKLAE